MKYCSKCGEQNGDHASFCSRCGTDIRVEDLVIPQPEPQQYNPNMNYQQRNQMPPTYLWQAIVVTILCCLPFGIAAIVNATQVESRFLQGNIEGSLRASRNAKNFSIWALILGVVGSLAYSLLVFFGVIAGFMDGFSYY